MADITDPTKLSDFSGFIQPEIAAPIFEEASKQSVLQSLAQRVDLGGAGKAIPVVTGKPVASWVDEGARKPTSKGTMTLKTMSPKKLAVIVVNSMEVVRADPGQYVSSTEATLAEAFAYAFDAAGFHDKLADGTGTGPFSTYLDQTTKTVEFGSHAPDEGGVWLDLNDALSLLVADRDANGRGKRLTGWAFDSICEPIFNGAVDANGRPLFIDSPLVDTASAVRAGQVMGRPAIVADSVGTVNGSSVVGYAGNFRQAAWGVVGGISFAATDLASVSIDGELGSLWENNLVAIRAEAEYGFLANDVDSFVKFTNSIPTASA